MLNEMIAEAERGPTVRRNATVGELLEAWFEMAAGDFSPSTVKEARGFIDVRPSDSWLRDDVGVRRSTAISRIAQVADALDTAAQRPGPRVVAAGLCQSSKTTFTST